MSASVTVSVIIPCRNRRVRLRECLMSVAAQSYRSLEVIVVDDASTKDIQPVIETVAWPDGIIPHYVRLEQNVGPGAAREAGRSRASGEFIAYLDSDDVWHPEFIQRQVQALQQDSEAGMCYCASIEFQALPITGREPFRKRSDLSFSSFLPEVLHGRPWDTSACMWTREATEIIGPWFPGWTWEDYEYDVRAGCHDIKVAFLVEVLCFKRQNYGGEQLSRGAVGDQKKVHQTQSLLEIARHVRVSGKVNEPDISEQLALLLYNNALYLLARGETDLGNECLNELAHFNCLLSRTGITVRLVKQLQTIVPSRYAARVGYRLRPISLHRAF